MTFDALLNAGMNILDALAAILPTTASLGIDPSAVHAVFGTAMYLDRGLPIHEILAAIGAYLVVRVALMNYGVARAIARWLPSWITGGG